ncbi:MAG: imidazole glycerol phosphate synthase subunit HisF [Candidatus Omnitrophota bacterium]
MQPVKIIPCLDIKDGRVVKGIKFIDLIDARDPVEAAAAYCAAGADELVFLDIAASVESRATRLDWVKRVKEATTVPFCVGGGIRNLDDMQALFDLGVDKVSINTAAVKNPDLVKEASRRFGREKIVVAIDGRKNPLAGSAPEFEVLIMGGEEATGIDVAQWAKQVEQLGAGEILLTSKDADGTKEGYDIQMTKAVAEAVSIPVTASGGAGKLEHLYQAVTEAKAANVLCASVFHFGGIKIPDAKQYLRDKGILVRI